MKKNIKTNEKEVIVTNSNDEKEVRINKHLETLTTTSSKIRYLLSEGLTRSQVSKKLNIIYQHVRNVEITPIKKQKD